MPSRSARQRNYRRGHLAEYAALVYLCGKLYRPLVRRYKTPVGEIDLIVKRGRTLVFVEVKQRKQRDDAAFAVHGKNQSRVVRAAQYFLSAHPEFELHQVRFDVCLIPWYGWPHHLRNAFQS